MAIARVATSSMSSGAGTRTFAMTVSTQTNGYLVVFGSCGDDQMTGVTFNGDAMTLLRKNEGSFGNTAYVWGLANPDVTTANVVATVATGDGTNAYAVYYSGVKQTGQPDAVAGGGSISTTVTTVSNGSVVVSANSAATSNIGTAVAGCVEVALTNSQFPKLGVYESDPIQVTPAGGSDTGASSGSGPCIAAAALIADPLPVSGPSNLKSYNSNAKANIKSINGNLLANIKSLNTNA